MCDHKKRNTHAYTGTVSQPGYNIQACCTEVMEMAWTDDSTLAQGWALGGLKPLQF